MTATFGGFQATLNLRPPNPWCMRMNCRFRPVTRMWSSIVLRILGGFSRGQAWRTAKEEFPDHERGNRYRRSGACAVKHIMLFAFDCHPIGNHIAVRHVVAPALNLCKSSMFPEYRGCHFGVIAIGGLVRGWQSGDASVYLRHTSLLSGSRNALQSGALLIPH